MRSDIRSECGACGRICNPLPGGFGHRPGRHYDRSARCLAVLTAKRASSPLAFAARKRGPKLSGGVRSPKREPRWSAERRACSAEHAAAPVWCRIGWMRLSGLRFPFFRLWEFCRGVMMPRALMRCENASAFASARGRGTARSSRSERRVVEGALDSPLRFRRKRLVESDAPSTTLRVVPLPRYRGAGRERVNDAGGSRGEALANALYCGETR